MNVSKNINFPSVGVVLLFLNIIGAIAFFLLSHRVSAQRAMEDRDYYDGIDGITWFCTALPVVQLFLLIDFVYLVYAVIALVKLHNLKPLAFCGVFLVLWIATGNIVILDGWIPKGTWSWRNSFPINLFFLSPRFLQGCPN